MNYTKREAYVSDSDKAIARFWRACADTKTEIWKVLRTGNLKGFRAIVFVPEDMLAAFENKMNPPVRKTTRRTSVKNPTTARCPLLGKGTRTGEDITGQGVGE
jgi:hypothetical protein